MIREYIIKISDEIMEEEIADRPQELVRCKDCVHAKRYGELVGCERIDGLREPDWYCADGEREKL